LDVSESRKPLRKIGKLLRKAESRWGKRKAVEENWILGEENQISGGENPDISQEIL
jgi:hypothetical protein